MPATIALISRSSETAIDQRQPDGSSAARRAGIGNIGVSPSIILCCTARAAIADALDQHQRALLSALVPSPAQGVERGERGTRAHSVRAGEDVSPPINPRPPAATRERGQL